MSVTYLPVQSSNIAEVGYDPDALTLYVRFLNGSEYAYDEVPPEAFEDLVNAPSVGQELNSSIKGAYRHRRV